MNEQQLIRYSRNIQLEEIGLTGQEKLLESKVLIIGAGGLGSSAIFNLAAAGIGTIGIIDNDIVDLSNLQRQIIHAASDIGTLKTISAKKSINDLNPDIEVRTYSEKFDDKSAHIITGYDFILDCTDNLETKFFISDICHLNKKPYSHAGIIQFTGQTLTVLPGKSACYRCIFGSIPEEGTVPKASEHGVLGVLPGIIGTIQATEAIKYLLGIGTLLTNKILTYNALETNFRIINIKKNPDCILCGK